MPGTGLRYLQLPIVSTLIFCSALLTIAFPTGGRGVEIEHISRATIYSPLQSAPFRGNFSRQATEEFHIQEIKDHILILIGKMNGSHQVDQTTDLQEVEGASPSSSRKYPPIQRTIPSDGTDQIQRTTVKNTRSRAEKIKFSPDTVSSDKNDVLVLFALRNYTNMEVDEAELVILLRYRHLQTNQSSKSRKPEVRRITIVVFRDTGNATSSGNASYVDRSSMTTSVFQIRRTKWVKVLLMRRWVQQALSSPTRTLRLRLVYDKSDSIEVVTTTDRRRRDRVQKKLTNPRRMRDGTGIGRTRQPKELRRNRKERVSPVLVVVKREKHSS